MNVILRNAFNFLDFTDIIACSMVSKGFRNNAIKSLIYQHNVIMQFIRKVKKKPQEITFKELFNAKILDLDNTYGFAIPENGRYNSPTNFGMLYYGDLEVPSELGKLCNLRELHLAGNGLKTVPSELGKLYNLRLLSLHGNKLRSIPKELGNLGKLNMLYIGNNKLECIPIELTKLGNLYTLVLCENGNVMYSSEFRKMRGLTIV